MAETHQADMAGQLARWKARGKAPAAQQKAQAAAKVIQLPLWPETKRGAINAVLRSALFAAVQGKGRVALDRELVAAQQGIEIRFTGWQLSQSDLDVWEQVLHLARTQALGTRCYFTAHGFLKALGRSTGKRDHEWLKSVFSRLSATDVQIRHKGRTYFGSLIDGGVRDEDTGRYVVEINPSWPSSMAGRSGPSSTGISGNSSAASPWPYGCMASMPATPSLTR